MPQHYRIANIVWMAFLVSIVVFAGVAYFMHQSAGLVSEPTLTESLSHPIVLAVSFMAVLNLVLSQLLPKIMVPPNTKLTSDKSFQLTILRCALIETVAVFGLIAAFITHQSAVSYLFSGVAFAMCLTVKPKHEEFT